MVIHKLYIYCPLPLILIYVSNEWKKAGNFLATVAICIMLAGCTSSNSIVSNEVVPTGRLIGEGEGDLFIDLTDLFLASDII
jgi:hypothetical protein